MVNSIGAALLYPSMVFSLHFHIECNGHESIKELSPRTEKLDQATFSANNIDANMKNQDESSNANESFVTHSLNNAILVESGVDQKL